MGKYSIENLLRFTDRGASNLATSLLDEIVSRDEVDTLNSLYKFSNYKKGGSLIERYLLDGQKELENIATSEIRQFMYNDGDGKFIESERKETVLNLDDGVKANKGRRKVCWKLDERGMLGESLLHVLTICNTDVHTYIAIYLLDMYPSLAQDFVEGEEYYGASAMHFAIAYDNSKLVKKLVEVGANCLQRANGKFFMPIDQQWPIPRPKTNFEGLSYFGEYPLAWAACCDDESSYNLLLKHGADPNMQDTYGNSILHVLVIRDKLKMYGYALRHPIRPASDRFCNKFGLTPLTLACKLGRNTIFREMLEFSSLEYWRYSNITCSGYPLNALDSLQPNGRANLNSALMIILKGNSTEHLDMLEGGVIQRLLEEKWKTFAQRYFYRRLGLTLFHLLNLSIAVFLRPTTREPLLGKADAATIVRYAAEIATCLGCIGFGIVQQIQEILAQGLSGFLVSLTTSPTKASFVLSCLLILSCIPCRVLEDRETEDILLTMAIPGSWFYLVFFAGAVRLTGPFVTMIYSMLTGDMFRFSIIYMIFLLGFTQAFYFLFKHPPSERIDTKKRFSSYPVTWMGLFHMTLGSYEYEEFRETYYQKLTQMVFAMFMVFTPILLLNMLIAMMGNTYCEVITQSEKEWVKQWANIIVALERAIDSKSAREFIQTYSIKMPSTDKNTEVRGVIVIKSKPKSKAKEKKQALSLWKRLGKRTVQELRKVGGSAAEVRRRYNLFRSKQPTARLRMGKVVQEWNPTPPPLFPQSTDPTSLSIDSTTSNAGFDNLLSQVASASGIDIENPATQGEILKENKELIKLPEYQECVNAPTTYKNVVFDGNVDLKSNIVPKEQVHEASTAYRNVALEGNVDLKSNTIPKEPFLKTSTAYRNVALEGNIDSKSNTIPKEQLFGASTTHRNVSPGGNFDLKSHNVPKEQIFGASTAYRNVLSEENVDVKSDIVTNEKIFLMQSNHSGIINPTTYRNLPVERETVYKSDIVPNEHMILNQVNQKERIVVNLEDLENLKHEMWNAHLTHLNTEFSEKMPDIKISELQPIKQNDEKGISVSIQTRIMNTRITKTRTRRRKDSIYPKRSEYSDSTSEKETKKGFLLHKKENNVTGFSIKGASKYRRRRKRNQISFQDKISADNVPCDIPISTKTGLNKSDM